MDGGQWKLYEAYNELHDLAQGFSTPFDAPAVLVVAHQTDGKSALVEALMGFQFNHVGGGTKTRRPVTLHMKFIPDCDTRFAALYRIRILLSRRKNSSKKFRRTLKLKH